MRQVVHFAGRDIRFECLERPFEFCSPFEGEDFVLLLFVKDTTITPAEQASLSNQMIRQGCRYAVCAGHHCSTWDDSIDMAFLGTDANFNPPDERFVMTTWHESVIRRHRVLLPSLHLVQIFRA